jgi:hypothetical protein
MCRLASIRVETKTFFFYFRNKRKLSENEQVFPKFRFAKIFVFMKVFVFAKIFVFAQVFARKFRCGNENFRASFRLRAEGKFFATSYHKKLYILTSILVYVYGYCLICFETISGFDHKVGYLYN